MRTPLSGLSSNRNGFVKPFVLCLASWATTIPVCFAAENAPAEKPFAERLGWGPNVVVVILHVDDVGMSHSSNLGAIGTGLFVLFVAAVFIQPMMKPADQDVQSVVQAARSAVYVSLLVASISATVFDLGVCFYAWAAVACGYQQPRERRALA